MVERVTLSTMAYGKQIHSIAYKEIHGTRQAFLILNLGQ
jgi:hypothetical protein